MNVVILGAPASGKGTQAELIALSFGLFHFDAGSLARKIAEHDPKIKEIVSSGQLIPEEVMTQYMLEHLTKEKDKMGNMLFEGFPRFVSQYKALEEFLKEYGQRIDVVIYLKISEAEAVKRISSRRVCVKCGTVYNLVTNPPKESGKCDVCGNDLILRDDDREEAVKVRFKYFHDNTEALLDYVRSLGMLTEINGERPIKEIYQDIEDFLQSYKSKNPGK